MNSGFIPFLEKRKPFLLCAAVLALTLLALFYKAFLPGHVVFSNDGPLGAMVAAQNRFPSILAGQWADLNWIGSPYPAPAPSLTSLFWTATSWWIPAGSAFYPPFSLLVLGVFTWLCFRMHKFSAVACLLSAVGATLNSDFVGTSAWGVCSQCIAFGWNFLALGLLADIASPKRWLRVALAGFAVGQGIIESYDIGALFSLFIAAYLVAQTLVSEGPIVNNIGRGIGRLAVVVVCAGLMAAGALIQVLFVSSQIKGVAGADQSAAERWSFATQYSIPKAEALGILVPGLFGFRYDTPDGGEYWGRAGSDPSWDEFVDSGGQRGKPDGAFRAGAGSNYAGVLVVLLAGLAVAQSLRKVGSAFSAAEQRLVWFWAAAAVVALLLMFGRFAPVYQYFYALPYVSTIRNPAKFLHIVEWVLLILFAYGAEALCRSGMVGITGSASALMSNWRSWWARATAFDRRWVWGSAAALVLAALAWLVYASSREALERHIGDLTNLQYAAMRQKADQAAVSESAAANARHSIRQVGRSVLFLILAVAIVALILSGYFRGSRARTGGVLLVALLVADLLPVNRPWVLFVNWRVKYETNPVIDFLRERPYEQRVAIFPLDRFVDFRRLPREMLPVAQQYSFFAQLYGIEWTQQLFQYYDIQSLDIRQEPRVASEKAAFEAVMALASPLRRWELTNTRYLLGPTAFVESLNQQLDAGKGRFRIAKAFDLAAKTGADHSVSQLEQVTTVVSTNGQLAVLDFAGALPRARLYTNWRVSTNDPAGLRDWAKTIQQRVPRDMATALAGQSLTDLATLHELADKDFDPGQTVLLAEPLLVASGTDQNPGAVKFESYAPKHILLRAAANSPAVLLLNDKYDPNWKVWVDGKPAELLRANFIMRGVFLDKAGEHRVEFKYQPPLTGLYISLVSMVVALGLLAYVGLVKPRASPVQARG